MPNGGTPPRDPNPGSPAPPPTDSGVCAISPSDLVGYTGNLINRVDELEQRIAELEAANLEVNQLSDISQQIGWVGGIEYLGIPGWTQTSYGTLIPPAGFSLVGSGLTMSDGNQYNGVYYDEDGVLQFGFLADGSGLSGTLPTSWNAAAAASEMDYAVTKFSTTAGSYSSSRGITITDPAPTSGEGDAKLTVSEDGIYLVIGFVRWFVGTASNYSGTVNLYTPDPTQSTYDYQFALDSSASVLTWKINTLLNLSAGNLIELELDVTVPGSGGTLEEFMFSAVKITDN